MVTVGHDIEAALFVSCIFYGAGPVTGLQAARYFCCFVSASVSVYKEGNAVVLQVMWDNAITVILRF